MVRRQHPFIIFLVLLSLGPLMLISGGVAALALLSQFLQAQITILPTGNLLDLAIGGLGAPAGSFTNYVTFMVAAPIAAGCLGGMKWALGSK